MNLQQDKFAYYYALYKGQHGAKARAGRDAGFKDPHVGVRLLKNPEIVKRVEEYAKKIKDEIEMQPKEIIARLQKIAKRVEPYEKATPKDAREALKDLAKYHSMRGFTDKLIIEHKIPFSDWSVEQIDDFVNKGIVPKGKRLPEIEGISPIVPRAISEKSGESIN